MRLFAKHAHSLPLACIAFWILSSTGTATEFVPELGYGYDPQSGTAKGHIFISPSKLKVNIKPTGEHSESKITSFVEDLSSKLEQTGIGARVQVRQGVFSGSAKIESLVSSSADGRALKYYLGWRYSESWAVEEIEQVFSARLNDRAQAIRDKWSTGNQKDQDDARKMYRELLEKVGPLFVRTTVRSAYAVMEYTITSNTSTSASSVMAEVKAQYGGSGGEVDFSKVVASTAKNLSITSSFKFDGFKKGSAIESLASDTGNKAQDGWNKSTNDIAFIMATIESAVKKSNVGEDGLISSYTGDPWWLVLDLPSGVATTTDGSDGKWASLEDRRDKLLVVLYEQSVKMRRDIGIIEKIMSVPNLSTSASEKLRAEIIKAQNDNYEMARGAVATSDSAALNALEQRRPLYKGLDYVSLIANQGKDLLVVKEFVCALNHGRVNPDNPDFTGQYTPSFSFNGRLSSPLPDLIAKVTITASNGIVVFDGGFLEQWSTASHFPNGGTWQQLDTHPNGVSHARQGKDRMMPGPYKVTVLLPNNSFITWDNLVPTELHN